MVSGLGSSLQAIINKIRRAGLVDKQLVQEIVVALQRALLMADVEVDLALELTARVKERALNDDVAPGVSRRDYAIKVIYDEITNLLGRRHQPLLLDPGKQNILLLVGIQGSGKTTSISKLARYYQKRGFKMGVIAGDTFRPGAFDQLSQLVEPLQVPIFGEPGEKKSLKVVTQGLKHFQKDKSTNLILVDTAGRHKEEKSLLKEMRQIAEKIRPTEIILVIDGTIGQVARKQAQAFHTTTDIGSIILTKLDGSAKGGGAISAVAATGAKIRFIGDGERVEDFREFDPNKYLSEILGMGDISSIVERVTDAGLVIDDDELMMAFKKGKITLRHLKLQMDQMENVGSLGKVLGMIPGFGQNMPPGFEAMGKENIRKFRAIFAAMTDEELDNPRVLNVSRRERIARGSGTTLDDVRLLLKQHKITQNMLKQYRGSRRKRQMLPGFG
ncbi:MAG: signal recognition particle receptor subunit alpha [Candidatus Hodarchaeales archaeon]